MSGFFGSNDATSRWGGYFKQAISNVETTFDSLLEQPQTQQQQQPSTTAKGKHELTQVAYVYLMAPRDRQRDRDRDLCRSY